MDETLVNFGSELKAIAETPDGSIKFGAWLVLYGSPERTDITRMRDYFTKSTDFDFEEGDKTTVYFNHGLDPKLKRRKLGTATLHYKDAGIWMEGQLKARDEYEAKIQQMIKAGKLGASSGVPAHLVERKSVGCAHEILMWPLGKDASLTPTPAEPRTTCVSLKSLMENEAGFYQTGFAGHANDEITQDEPPAGLSFADHSRKALAAIQEFCARADSLADIRCVKSNRLWSQANYALLNGVAAELADAGDFLKSLADAYAPRNAVSEQAEDGAGTEAYETARALLAQIELTRARINGVTV